MQLVWVAAILASAFLQPSNADWAAVSAGFDAYAKISSGSLIVGNGSGILYTHTKNGFDNAKQIPVASSSKWVAASIFGQLLDAGVMHLNDTPSKYFFWWTKDPKDARSRITLQQLLSFTSGFGKDDACLELKNISVIECAQLIYEHNANLPYPPGTAFYYTPNHLQVAGAMAAAATGKDINVIWAQGIRAKVGMAAGTLFYPLQNTRLSGGLYISPNDYAKWLFQYFLGNLVAPETLQAIETDNTPQPAVQLAYSPVVYVRPPRVWHYCLSQWFECDSSPFTPACAAAAIHSSPGMFGMLPWIDRRRGYWGLIGTYNPDDQLAFAYSTELLDTLRPLIIQAMG